MSHQPLLTRLAPALLLYALLSGCASQLASYEQPKDTPLQDPPPGKAIVYLLRAPHDSAHIAVFIGERKVASLAPERYTAVALSPGQYVLVTRSASAIAGEHLIAPEFRIHVEENQRRFLGISGATTKRPAFAGMVGSVPLLIDVQGTASGTRSWKELAEIDAQGFMSISKPSLPERDAL